jgi:peptidylprolyl isomerase
VKTVILVIATCVAALAIGCGGGDTSSSSTEPSGSPGAGGSTESAESGGPTGAAESTTSGGATGPGGATTPHEPGSVESNAASGATATWVKIDKTRPKVAVRKGQPPKKLIVRDLEEGTGPAAKVGDELTIMYVGYFYPTGKKFTASWDWGKPTTFKLGGGAEDAGWETGLEGMREGGRRELIVPGGFKGRSGFPPGSGPKDSVLYVVDLFAIN